MTGTRNLEDEVWSQELAYYGYFKAGDVDHMLAFWHEDGMGWPEQPAPMNVAAARLPLAQALASLQLESCTFELVPVSVRVYNNSVGVTHCEAHNCYVMKDGAEIVSHTRGAQTWLGTEDGWKIIGGMEASLAHP